MSERVTKKVELHNIISKTQFEILKYLTQFLTIFQIAKLRKTSRTAVYKTIKQLLQKGLIRKIDRGAYEVTNKGTEGLHSFTRYTNQIRLHNLRVKINILKTPPNWELKRNKIVSMRALSKQVNLKNNQFEIHSFSNIKVETRTKSVIINLPSFYGKSPDDTFQQALEILDKTIPKIENLFNIILIKDRKPNIEIISNHFSKLRDNLSKIYRKEKKKLYVKDEEGKIWLISDYSFRTDELETIDTIQAKEDMDTVQTFLNDLRKNPVTISQIIEIVRDVTANQVIFDKNMKSHIEAVKKLGNGVENLTRAVKSVKQENIKLKKKLQVRAQTDLDRFL